MKKAIIFVDANNWYHNVKKFFEPGDVDMSEIAMAHTLTLQFKAS